MKLRKHRKSRKRKSLRKSRKRKSLRKSRKRKSRGGRRKSRRSRKKRGAGPRANRAAKARHKEQQRLRDIHLTQCKTGKKKRMGITVSLSKKEAALCAHEKRQREEEDIARKLAQDEEHTAHMARKAATLEAIIAEHGVEYAKEYGYM